MKHLSPRTVFFLILATVLLATHTYIWQRVSAYLQLSSGQRQTAGLVLGLLAVLTLVAYPVSRALPREAAGIFMWIVFPWLGILLIFVTVLIIADTAWMIKSLFLGELLHNVARREFLARSFGVAALCATALLSAASLWYALRPVSVKALTITLDRLPKALDGLRIVQITDMHVSPMVNERWVRDIVNKVNALSPDVIVITGDLVDGPVSDLAPFIAPLADLKARLGVYFTTGNHEFYSGVESWCRHIAAMGIRVLRNERISLTLNGETFDLAGTEDYGSGRANLAQALSGRSPERPLILLAHQPVEIEAAASHGVDLQLSGHTHGGQIWPFNSLVLLQQPYVRGLYRRNHTQIYVSAGTGYWGPPMRLGTSAEITHITLRSA